MQTKRDTGRQRQRQTYPLLVYPLNSCTIQDWARPKLEFKTQPRSFLWVAGPIHWSSCLLPLGLYISKKLECTAKPGTWSPTLWLRVMGAPNSSLTSVLNTWSWVFLHSEFTKGKFLQQVFILAVEIAGYNAHKGYLVWIHSSGSWFQLPTNLDSWVTVVMAQVVTGFLIPTQETQVPGPHSGPALPHTMQVSGVWTSK